MSTLEVLEQQIEKLDDGSFAKFTDCLLEFDQSRWDKQIEADYNAGKLDKHY
jgi:hypothetical protein